MAALSVTVIEGPAAIESLAAEWDAAVPQSFTAALSQASWYLAWQETFPPLRAVAFVARENARLVGLLPMALVKTDARGLFFRQASTFAGGDYQSPVVAPGSGPEVLFALLDASLKYFGRRIVYRFASIPETDFAAQIIPCHLSSKNMVIAQEVQTAPRLSIGGRTYSQIESTWSPSHRTDVRRQRKRLTALGPLSLWRPENLAEAQTFLQEFFIVHDEKWLSQGQPGRFRDAAQRRHFVAIVNRMWDRGLHLSALRCGDKNVSYGIGFIADKWLQWYRPTYKTEYHNLSPGKIHIALLLEEACQNNWNGFDFLTGAEGYKLQWSNETMKVIDYYASFSASLPAFQWFTKGKPYVRDQVGPMMARMRARIQKNSLLSRLLQRN
jgi:CelD/BcsL family acetyltransferase involved in cellulose biosynthesis